MFHDLSYWKQSLGKINILTSYSAFLKKLNNIEFYGLFSLKSFILSFQ